MRHRLAKHSHVIDKHFSMLPSPELWRRNIDRYHTFFHANKWQTELAILSLQTCMLTVLAAHWLFIARTVQWIRVALWRTQGGRIPPCCCDFLKQLFTLISMHDGISFVIMRLPHSNSFKRARTQERGFSEYYVTLLLYKGQMTWLC